MERIAPSQQTFVLPVKPCHFATQIGVSACECKHRYPSLHACWSQGQRGGAARGPNAPHSARRAPVPLTVRGQLRRTDKRGKTGQSALRWGVCRDDSPAVFIYGPAERLTWQMCRNECPILIPGDYFKKQEKD